MAIFSGNNGDNLLVGTDGDDQIYGLGGNDLIDGRYGFDLIDGGDGIDTTTYAFYAGGVNANLATGVVSFPGNSNRTDTLVGIENLIGSQGNDIITGDAGDNDLSGGAGDDILDGGFGFDQLDGGDGNDTTTYDFYSGGIIANLETGVVSFPGNSDRTDRLVSIENLIGSRGNDIITGDAGDNNLSGGAGDDILDGGFGFDRLDGGTGTDTVTYDFYAGGIIADLQTGVVSFPGNSTRTDTLVDVENLVGSRGSDIISGNALNNVLSGNSGNDTLDGRGGNDTLVGGLGDDTYIISDTSDVTVEALNEGTDTVNAAVNYTLGDNLENLTLTGTATIGTGNALNNTIRGNAGINSLNGKAGNDTLIGGLGNDIYTVNDAGDRVIENVNEGTDTVFTSVSYTLEANVENLFLTETASLNGTGNTLDNLLIGNGGVNTLDGAAGNDMLIGAAGRDLLKGGTGADKFVFVAATDGPDQILDFSKAEGDKLLLVASGFNGLPVGQLNVSQFVQGNTAKDSNDRLIYSKSQGILFYDRDGNGSASKVKLATFATKPTLGAVDVLVAASPF